MSSTLKLFGFSIEDKGDVEEKNVRSFVNRENDDGAVVLDYLNAFTGSHSSYIDLDGAIRTENQLIDKYREISAFPDVAFAIDEITSEAIVTDEHEPPVKLSLEKVKVSVNVKKKIEDAFDQVLNLLYFKQKGFDIFKRWYVDGRLFYHILIDEKKPSRGIIELRYINPKNLKKIREVNSNKRPQASIQTVPLYTEEDVVEYYAYSEIPLSSGPLGTTVTPQIRTIKIHPDSIASTNSGIYDQKTNRVLSYLHDAIRPANNARLLDDSLVIYRLSRAPERRIFYIDVGNLPKTRAEQYMHQVMNKYKNKLVYDSVTGDIKDDRKFMAFTEDFWLPRRDGSRGTEISTLPGGQNLGQIEDIEHLQEQLFRSLHVPLSRFNNGDESMFGNTGTISRDELRFMKFITRLRTRFAILFDDLLGKQLELTGVMSKRQWEFIKQNVFYDFLKDNYFTELYKNQVEADRMNLVTAMDAFVGKYYSIEYVQRTALKFSDEDIKRERKKIEEEKALGIMPSTMPGEEDNNADGGPPDGGSPMLQNRDLGDIAAGQKASAGQPGGPQTPQAGAPQQNEELERSEIALNEASADLLRRFSSIRTP